ncbi:MAG: Rne/Rng family ribonuclease [Pyrinomonadaceae bacterium]
MSKEMIISVNGREKKIAIVDDGQVTEFYIERGEENSGVVGNIYKGRVMRVLPGMQSAFVDIGLERDAFLYVSDFFDEEEEIERIILEKAEKSPDEAEREATDQIYKERLKREKQMEEAQELAEPLAEKDEEEEEEDKSSKGKRKKSRRGKKAKETSGKKEAEAQDEEDEDSKDSRRKKKGVPPPVFEIEDSGFERIIDDTDTGDMFKDAYLQEAIVDQVRAIEFDMESQTGAEVGSLIDSVADQPNGFQRIADEEEEEASTKSGGRTKRRTRRSTKKQKAEKEEPEEKPEEIEEKEEEKPKAKRTTRSKRTTTSRRKPSAKKDSEERPEEAEETKEEEKPKTKSASRTRSTAKKKTSTRRKKSPAKKEKLEDAEASVKDDADPAAEMAVRRGGRGRRRSTKSKSDDKPSDDNSNKKSTRKSSGGNRRSNRRQSSQPTITDLLNEGQEILVQIAKEPIARKGARITSHIALPGRFLVYMPTIEHLGVSRKIESSKERGRLRTLIQKIKEEVDLPSGGFIVRTAGVGISEEDLRQDANYLVRTWLDIKLDADKAKSPELVHQDLDIILRLLRDHLSDEFSAIRVDSEEEYRRIVEFVNRIQPRLVKRVKFYTREEPILEAFGVQEEINKALKPRVWLKSGGYLVINQTEALVAIDVNTGKFVGKGNARLEDTITKTNMEAVEEIARQIRLRDLGGIIVLDLIDMEDRRNRHKVLQALQDHLSSDKSPTKVLSFNDFGLIIMTRKRVKQSLERTLCSPCEYCQSAGWVKSPQTICYEILEESRRLSKNLEDIRQTTLRVHPEVAKALRESESVVLDEIEDYLGNVDVTGDASIHQEQFDFAFI